MTAKPSSVCILGAGPIRIGQACEFDYSGVQGVRALREEGCRVILVNSNPATVMTDARLAHRSYVEPLTAKTVTTVLERERPEALIPTLGGQTALNLAVKLEETGVLERLGVRLLGASVRSIRLAEDREEFRLAMEEAGLPVLPAATVTSVGEGLEVVEKIGLPAILRPSFTLGGWGGGAAHDREAFERLLTKGLEASPTNQVLIEASVLGWKEFELEVMRDSAGAFVVVCSIENLDPMGVHTGDSITVAPAQTLTDREYQVLRDAARTVLDAVGVATGGANVQFAVNPEDGRYVVIEMNPRVSRSSALASKATGFPIARIAAKVALGRRLDEIVNDITGSTPASFEPALDYVVVKIPRFAFEKFPGADSRLGTSMKAVGEVAAMGRSFEAALLKAVRSLEVDRDSLEAPPEVAAAKPEELERLLAEPSPERLWELAEALRRGWSIERVFELTAIDPWFLRRISGLVAVEQELIDRSDEPSLLAAAKRLEFSDDHIACRRLSGQAACRYLRGRVRGPYTIPLRQLWRRRRAADATPPRRHPRRRSGTHRPGNRVRCLLRGGGGGAARRGLRGGDGQLQPGDGVHRLRRGGPPALRPAPPRGRARDLRRRTSARRSRPARRSDPAQAGGGSRTARGADLGYAA